MDGILVVNKPRGITSHDVVDRIRRTFHIKKVGHAGTLDPIATGVLILLLGTYTKRQIGFLNDDKAYQATMKLGLRTTTGDTDGKILKEGADLSGIDEIRIREVFSKFCGEIEQVPPMYSAKKVNGIRLYKLARKGKELDLESRRISIKELVIENINLPEIKFNVRCSKGTYIRKLCQDIGEELGSGATMTTLCRTASGQFSIDQAKKLDEVKVEDLLRN